MSVAHLAIDLGASSGRAIVGVLDGSPVELRLQEVHRFEHTACPTPTGPVWDLTGIWLQVLSGLRAGAAWCQEHRHELVSIGVDTWGVDWTLLGPSGELLALSHCYRDPQNEAACRRVLEQIGGFEQLYERTGIQLIPFNTLFQLAARHQAEPQLFDAAARLVFLPDLLHYWLSGELVTERTIASTSNMLAIESGQWDTQLLDQVGLPADILGPLVEPGALLGTLRQEVAEAASAPAGVQVIAPASHDTASAVAAVPATGKADWAYLSSGTWSLLGAELDHPVTSAVAREVPFTNERGAQSTIRFLKIIAGLWLVQELRRELQKQGDTRSFADLAQEARNAGPGGPLIDPNHDQFAVPGNMQEKIRQYVRETQQTEFGSVGQIVRCCLESLALCYGQTLDQMETVLGKSFEVLHVVGGGSQNKLLSEMTAAVVDRPVITGPIEATAIGNILVQAIGCGELSDLAELRAVVTHSFELCEVVAEGTEPWQEKRDKFAKLIAK